MAITFVGSNTGVWAGATTGTNNISLTALTGGSAGTAAIGDLVVALYATGSTANRTLTITGYTTISTEQYSNGTTNDTNFLAAYKYLTAADTTVTFSATGSTADAGAAAVYVFRGVNSTTPIGNSAPAVGTATGRPTAPAIVASSTGSFLLIAGAGAAATGAVYTAPSLTSFRSVTSADTQDAMLGAGYVTNITGTYTPTQFTGGTTNAADSWAAFSIEILSAPIAVTISETSTASDTQNIIYDANGDILEDVNFSEDFFGGLFIDLSRTEPVAFSDLASSSYLTPSIISESSTAGESSTEDTTLSSSTTETQSISESSSNQLETFGEVSENNVYHDLHDTVSSTYITYPTVEESITVSESNIGGAVYNEDLTEAGVTTETNYAVFIINSDRAESQTAGEFAENILTTIVSISETITSQESQLSQLITFVVTIETVATQESSIESSIDNASITESHVTEDLSSISVSTNTSIPEQVTAQETSSNIAATSAAVSETQTSSETISNTLITNSVSENALSATDSPVVQLEAVVYITETILDLHDDLGGSTGAENYVLEEHDAMDDQDSTMAHTGALTEQATGEDVADYKINDVGGNVDEEFLISDTVDSKALLVSSITEIQSLTDTSLRRVVHVGSLNESIVATSEHQTIIEAVSSIIETLQGVDSSTNNIIATVFHVEQVEVIEESQRTSTKYAVTDEQLVVLENSENALAFSRSLAEQLQLTDQSENITFAVCSLVEPLSAQSSHDVVMNTFVSLIESGNLLDTCSRFVLVVKDYYSLGRGAAIALVDKTEIMADIEVKEIKVTAERINPPRVDVVADVIEVSVELKYTDDANL